MRSTAVASRFEEVARIIDVVEKQYCPPTHHASSSRKHQYAEHIRKEAQKVLDLLKQEMLPEQKAHLRALNTQ